MSNPTDLSEICCFLNSTSKCTLIKHLLIFGICKVFTISTLIECGFHYCCVKNKVDLKRSFTLSLVKTNAD